MDDELKKELKDLPLLRGLQGKGDGLRTPPGLLAELTQQTLATAQATPPRRRRLPASYAALAAALLLLLTVAWWLWREAVQPPATPAVALTELPTEEIYTYLALHVDELELESLAGALPRPEALPVDTATERWLDEWIEEDVLY